MKKILALVLSLMFVLTLLNNILMMMPRIAPFTIIGSTAGK